MNRYNADMLPFWVCCELSGLRRVDKITLLHGQWLRETVMLTVCVCDICVQLTSKVIVLETQSKAVVQVDNEDLRKVGSFNHQ